LKSKTMPCSLCEKPMRVRLDRLKTDRPNACHPCRSQAAAIKRKLIDERKCDRPTGVQNVCADCGVVIGRHQRKTLGPSRCRKCRLTKTDTRYTKTSCSQCGQKVKVRNGQSTALCRSCRATNRVKTCVGCASVFYANPKDPLIQKYCSLRCANSNKPRPTKARPVVVYIGPKFTREPKRNVNSIPRTKRIFKSVQCKICDRYFVTLFTDVTCSTMCQDINDRDMKSQAKSRRRARKKLAFVENVSPKYIFERDKYRCNLKLSPSCNGKTDPAKVVPHPRAPTIDHIIPLGVGVENDGWHSNANSWCACFECNCIKRDRGGGEQLALIG